MSALDSIEDFRFRVRKYPPGDPRRGSHEMHIEIITTGNAKISSRAIVSEDIPPDLSALDWLIQRASNALKDFIRKDREDGLRVRQRRRVRNGVPARQPA